ncbi:MAG: amidohydrolase [Firmicutes bacterium]|nr:amidohydrolase [Bacillota bacterium]
MRMAGVLKSMVDEILPRVKEWRWDIHQHPELSKQEHRTAGIVEPELAALGLEVKRIGETGVLGVLRGAREGKTLALRADMDALSLPERTGCPYSSKVEGVMHACGHDAHTAILLGVAHVLSRLKDDLAGKVKFLFQPAEETTPEGGAPLMIQGGVLEHPRVDMILALHVWPDLPVGTIGVRSGPMMAASDRVFLKVLGSSCHGSAPHQGVDAIVAASQVVVALQTIVSRNVSPLESAVLTFGTVKGGHRYNVIADEVVLEGTCRTLKPEIRKLVPERLASLASQVAAGFGATCEVEYVYGYPPCVNTPEGAALLKQAGTEALGERNVVEMEYPWMGAEDFAFYLERVPGALFLLGSTPEGGQTIPLHNSAFLVDEAALPVGIEVFVQAALNYLKG